MNHKRSSEIAPGGGSSEKKAKQTDMEWRDLPDSSSDVTNLKPTLHRHYTDRAAIDKCAQYYRARENIFKGTDVILHTHPFSCCELPHFIGDDQYLKDLQDELQNLKFFPKNNDLYKFQQSDDLKNVHTPNIQQLRSLLYKEFRGWLQTVTDIPLNETVDLSCSIYKYTDSLLCHDDQLEGRRVAFIYYLVPPWVAEDGGTLDLFTIDENQQALDIVKRILPEWNKLVFFEVTPLSFHQVAEVLSKDKCRLSVSGWFHGPLIHRPEPYMEKLSPLEACLTAEEQLFYQWINPVYLDVNVQAEIQEKFEANSEIELQDFINPMMYECLEEALHHPSLEWIKRGPANKRCYQHIEDRYYPAVLMNCVQFFKSDAMFVVLSKLTGLDLHELAYNNDDKKEESSASNSVNNKEEGDEGEQPSSTTARRESGKNPRCRGEVRRWMPGCYTLMTDTDTERDTEYTLDARFFIGCPDWQAEFGGYTSYIVKEEEEELLTVKPVPNSLALIYRDNDTLQFVKHINDKANRDGCRTEFYDISLSFYE